MASYVPDRAHDTRRQAIHGGKPAMSEHSKMLQEAHGGLKAMDTRAEVVSEPGKHAAYDRVNRADALAWKAYQGRGMH